MIPSLLDYIHGKIDPSYVEMKEETKKAVQTAELNTATAFEASLVFGTCSQMT